MAPSAVIFDAVSLSLGTVRILDAVSARVPRGGNTVLVGPNGAGKTSLLLCLLGETSHEGRIVLPCMPDGRQPRLAYVPQQLALEAGLPLLVEEFLLLGTRQRPLWLGRSAKDRARAADSLALVGAQHLAARRMGQLSGGELRRVLLAAALGRKPDILVLDEPEAGVDVRGEALFWQSLDTARRTLGFTQIMVSHNLSLAAHYATHVICLNRSVQIEGPPRQSLSAGQLLRLFGMPIHLYPEQCEPDEPGCPTCGAVSPPEEEHGTHLRPLTPLTPRHMREDDHA
ncbi:MAG: metal ABC transporter ATP-binding protein [Desulfovibrionaceae bacterium]|nr:metal ABC transporter ATP-binding protein [Desulfovibrionaceae bacterium]